MLVEQRNPNSALVPVVSSSIEEYQGRTTVILCYVDNIFTSSSHIITVRTVSIQQINIKQKRSNMMTPTSPLSPKSPNSVASQISPTEQYMSGWMPSTPVIQTAIAHIQISTSSSRSISTQFSLGSPLIDLCLQSPDNLSPRRNLNKKVERNDSSLDLSSPMELTSATSPHAIFSPTAGKLPRELAEDMNISPITERILSLPPKPNTVKRLMSPPQATRKRRSFTSIEQSNSTPSSANTIRHKSESDLPRSRHTRSKHSNSHFHARLLKYQSPPPKRLHPLLVSINHLATPLIPLISVTNGLPHPDFPTSLLKYHLLTHAQLDSLARWYHQTTDAGPERAMYPSLIRKAWVRHHPDDHSGDAEGEAPIDLDLEVKRRRFGKFIGLRGCESPVSTSSRFDDLDNAAARKEQEEEKESLEQKMEREWKAAIARAEEERIMNEKAWRGRF